MEKTIQDGTASFAVRDKRIKALVDLFFPVGTIISRDDGNEPEILSYGKWIKIAPGRVLQGVGGGVTGEAGQDVGPGLPNITGASEAAIGTSNSITITEGAIYFDNKSPSETQYGMSYNSRVSSSGRGKSRFDASKSNPIYGASDTVQPAAHLVVYWKRVE